jgi:hypothetical protein
VESATGRRDDIEGWGADLDPQNRPAVPKERTPPRLDDVPWEYPEQQPVRIEVFHSTERPGITPVFGTACPPKGLSGALRRRAFRRSENDLRHWLMLLAADRVDAIEGRVGDLRESPRARRVAAGVLVAGVLAYVALRRAPARQRRRLA